VSDSRSSHSAEMARRGRLGAYVTLSRHDPREINAKAREVFRTTHFQEKARTEASERGEVLLDEEIARRAEYLRLAHYQRMAIASARARRRKPGRAA